MKQLATFSGTLHALDVKHNIAHAIEVPPGVAALRIVFSFSPLKPGEHYNMITLSVFGPRGFRGAGHRHGARHEVVLSAGACTPGYHAGAIDAGLWQVVLDTHMIVPDAPCPFTLVVFADSASAEAQPVRATPAIRTPRGPGWYRGDLHAHSLHSDARWDVPDLVAWARATKLDFATLSDHNTTSGVAEFLTHADDGLLCIGAMELTTFYGHALALNTDVWVDWRTEPGGTRSMRDAANDVMARGARLVIAHPRNIGDPICTGCRWVHSDVWPAPAKIVEVWNNSWGVDSHNNEGLQLAYEWLNHGHRLAFTAGTDNHGSQTNAHFGYNVVYAQSMTADAILDGIAAGHSCISSGPALRISARRDAQVAHMGGTLAGHGPVTLTVDLANAPTEALLRVVADGKVMHERRAETGSHTLGVHHAHWCTAELRAADGCMLAVTNPIFTS